jgi:oligopeptide transport system ATP-binding protein
MNPADPQKPKPLLSIRRLKVNYRTRRILPWHRAPAVRAVDDIHFDLYAGQTLGIVGAPGCGKRTLALALSDQLPTSAGSIRYRDQELTALSKKDWLQLRPQIQLASLNGPYALPPRKSAIDVVAESLRGLRPAVALAERRARATAALAAVGVEADIGAKPAGDLDRSTCVRVALARALATNPQLLICDELLSGLEAAAQQPLITLLTALRGGGARAVIHISDDFALTAQLADRVLVMYLGKVMEQGAAASLHSQPKHPYSRELLTATPVDARAAPPVVSRWLPSRDTARSHPPMGCVYHPRCPLAEHACVQSVPLLRRVKGEHYVACHFVAGGR